MHRFIPVVAILLLSVPLVACATPGRVHPDVWHRLTPAQQAEATVLEAAIGRLAEACRQNFPAASCTPPSVIVTSSGTTPHYDP
jgi:hypothetical protein